MSNFRLPPVPLPTVVGDKITETHGSDDSLESVYRRVIDRMGGAKKVGCAIWPTKTVKAAAQRLNDITNEDCPDKFALEEHACFLRMARDAGQHEAMQAFCALSGYTARPIGFDPPGGDGSRDSVPGLLRLIQQDGSAMRQLLVKLVERVC